MGCGASASEANNTQDPLKIEPAELNDTNTPKDKAQDTKNSSSLKRSASMNKSQVKNSPVKESKKSPKKTSTKSLPKDDQMRAMNTTKTSNISQNSSQKNTNKISPSKVKLDIHREVRENEEED